MARVWMVQMVTNASALLILQELFAEMLLTIVFQTHVPITELAKMEFSLTIVTVLLALLAITARQMWKNAIPIHAKTMALVWMV
jgi:hypothetical protein